MEVDEQGVTKSTARGRAAVTLLTILFGTVIGFVIAYVTAFIVVKLSLPLAKLVVGLPLIAVVGIAWLATRAQSLRESVVTIGVAAAIAVALLFAWKPPHPAALFTSKSEVTGVEVKGNDATIQLRSTREMTAMPPALATVGYAALLACFAVIAATLGHGLMQKKRPLA